MPVNFLKKVWKNRDDPTLAGGIDPELQASEFNRIETGIKDTSVLANANEAAIASHLTDAVDAHDASAISVADPGNHFAALDVEAALAELFGISGGTVFSGGTITNPTTVQTTNPGADQVVIRQPNSETGYAMLVYGPPDLTVNTEHRWFMLHPEGGMCLTSAYEPNWAILHLYKWGAGQAKPILRITNELAAHPTGPDDLFVVDQNGGLIMTPRVDFVDPVRIYDYLGNLIFEIKRDGEILGMPTVIQIPVLADPKARVGFIAYLNFNLPRYATGVYSGTLNEHIDYDVSMTAGSWYLDTYVAGRNDQGKVDVSIDGTSIGSIDAYDVSAVEIDKKVTIGPFALSAAARRTLSYKVIAKNPASGGTNVALRHALLRRA